MGIRSAFGPLVAAGLVVGGCARNNPLFGAVDDVGGSGDDGGDDTRGGDDDDDDADTKGGDDDDDDDDDDLDTGDDDDDDDDEQIDTGDDDDDDDDNEDTGFRGATEEGPGESGEDPPHIYFYGTPAAVTGDLSKTPNVRAATSGACELLAMDLGLVCGEALALLTVSAEDSLFELPDHGLPEDAEILSRFEELLWDDFADLIELGPYEGVEKGTTYWTGQSPDVDIAENCDGWASEAKNTPAGIFDPSLDPPEWWASEGPCDVQRSFMCLCW